MFKVLEAHEEVEPKAVLKNQSKRAKKRLLREEAKKQEVPNANGDERLRSGPNCSAGNALAPHAVDPDRDLDSTVAGFYVEAFGNTSPDTDTLNDIISMMQTMRTPAGPDRRGPGSSEANGGRDGPGQAPAGPECSGPPGIDFPPGPGPGPGAGVGGLARWAPCEPSGWPSVQVSPVRTAASTRLAGGTLGATAGGCGSSPNSCSSSCAPTPASGRRSPTHPRPPNPDDFPVLTPAPSAPPAGPAGVPPGWGQGDGSAPPFGRRRDARGGGRSSARGVRVLHKGRPHKPGAPHPHGPAPHGSGHDRDEDGSVNIALLWELLDAGMQLREDPLAGGCAGEQGLASPDSNERAAIRRQVEAQFNQLGQEKPVRGVSKESMIEMMTKTHQRQRRPASGARRAPCGGAAEGPEARANGGGADGGDSEDEDSEQFLYLEPDESRDWRKTKEWMERNDWVQESSGKHFKYRRLLPNGTLQTQMVCCSPSDALRGIRNLQAQLARKDARANEVILAWRQEQRRLQKEAAAAAALATVQEE